jgi:hypothetical protein
MRNWIAFKVGFILLAGAAQLHAADAQQGAAHPSAGSPGEGHWGLLEKYCSECHNAQDWAGGVAFDTMTPDTLHDDAKVWEAAVRKLRGRMMPPPGKPRPDNATVDSFVSWLETSLDSGSEHPQLARIALHRLNRTEYANAIEDLLALRIDPGALLPKDDESDGFDNVANVLKVSPSFLDQYISAARFVSNEAVGEPAARTMSSVYRVQPGAEQSHHIEGLPLGTRGGMLIEHLFPAQGEYSFSIGGLASAGYVIGLEYQHTVVMTIDGQKVFEAKLGGEEDLKAVDQKQAAAEAAINARFKNIRVKVSAGPHRVGVAFVARSFAESDVELQPFVESAGMDRIPNVRRLEIVGPFDPAGLGDTPSRKKIFVCKPSAPAQELPCAKQILTQLARRAYRRPVTETDIQGPLRFYESGRQSGSFDVGIQHGLMAILASPKFLYRAEPPPANLEPGASYRVSDLELASRLSFFLWSSLPDEELLSIAEQGKLKDPQVLERQVRRMLADPRARSLVTNFAFQWLRVRALDGIDPDAALFPNFTDSLRDAFKKEMELFVGSIFLEDRSVLDLLTADHTFVNERLALHYGIPNIRGSQFRRVALSDPKRWGLLGKGSVLMVTSYANRTAPVLRGAWILENITGTPPVAPPPDVEALIENQEGAKAQTVRERMNLHRAKQSCNACHGVMDPLGFALENFDAVGAWRVKDSETGTGIDSSGELADGSPVSGPEDLRRALLKRPDQFVQTLTEKLLTYALGRSVEYHDMPTVRAIVRDASRDNYRFSAIVTGIVKSASFQMQTISKPEPPAKDKGPVTANVEAKPGG